MFTEEQIKAIIQENERLRKENDALSGTYSGAYPFTFRQLIRV